MLTAKNIITILVIVVLIMGGITFCRFAEITDLIHTDTEKFSAEKGKKLNAENLDQYQINGILFIPYIRQNPFKSYDDKYYSYSLRLAAYTKDSYDQAVINYVTIEGINDAKLKKITKDLNKELKFNSDVSSNLKSSDIQLIEEINNYNMELSDKSQIKVVLNVSVEVDGKNSIQDVEYIFETRVRKYLVQR